MQAATAVRCGVKCGEGGFAMSESHKLVALGVGVALLAYLPSAFAVGAAGAGPNAAIASKATPAAKPGDATGQLRQGSVTAVSAKGDRIEIQGKWHSIVAGQTQIFQQGRPARPEVLKVGQLVRYTASENTAGNQRLGVLYVP